MRIKITIGIAIIIIISLFIAINSEKTDYSNRANLLYKQKASNITFSEFSTTGELVQKISAKNWIEYDNKPSIVTLPNIQKYTNQSTISADIATQISEEKLELSGNVEIINKENITHNLQTTTLIAVMDKDYFYSDEAVKYSSTQGKIFAGGIKIFTDKNIVEFQKNSEVLLASGSKILSSNTKASIINGRKKFESSSASNFISSANNAQSSNGFTLYDNQTQLLGEVKIQQTNSNNSHIITKDLLITNDVYTAKRSTYTENAIQVTANNMHYNESKQLITLTNNVKATYN